MSDDEDSDFDPDEIMRELEGMKKLLQRHVGKYKNVACLREMDGHWPKVSTIQSPKDEKDLKQIVTLVNDAEENERKRRMSVPFAQTLTDDIDLEETSQHVVSMHEELMHLFAIHDAKFQAECEQERRTVENSKQRVQEQLLKKANLQLTRQVFEEERQRRIELMESFLTGDSEDSLAIAETNDKLSLVHEDLINAFKLMEKAKKEKENNQLQAAEERKEVFLQDIRRRLTKKQHENDFELARQEKMIAYNKRQVTTEDEDFDRTLVHVQEDLLKLFGKLKKDRKIKNEESRVEQSSFKNMMQEELLHKTLGKQANELEAHEKARRIHESTNVTEEDAKRQKTMDMLLGVQRQLLNAMSHAERMPAKQQIHQVKFMNARTNMLQEIRNLGTRIPHNTYRTGRRLSTIGEKLSHK